MKLRLPCFLAALLLVLTGCNYDAPLTATPTQKVDERLLGNWEWVQPGEEHEWMVVRRLDASTYTVVYGKDKPHDRPDLYRAYHSDFAGKPFLSVQNLQPGGDDRKYTYVTWALADGTRLTLRSINTKVIPEQHTATAGMQQLVEKNRQNPELLNEEMVFTRPAPEKP